MRDDIGVLESKINPYENANTYIEICKNAFLIIKIYFSVATRLFSNTSIFFKRLVTPENLIFSIFFTGNPMKLS